MKTTNLKFIAYALSVLILMQSCVIYKNQAATVEQAVLEQNKVMIKTSDNRNYKFLRLEQIENQLYGIQKSGSKTHKELASDVKYIDQDEQIVKILLPEDIKEIRIQDKPISTLATIATVGAATMGLIIGLGAIISSNWEWKPGPGN